MDLLHLDEIARPLPDLARLGRLRQLLEQGETIPARPARLRAFIGRRGLNEQIVQEIAELAGHELLDARDQLLLAPLQGRDDQGREPMLARQLNTLADHQVEAVPENQLRLEMGLGHGGDLPRQEDLGLIVEAPVSVELQDEALVPLPRPDGILSSGERHGKIQLVRRVADVAVVVILGSEEPLGHAVRMRSDCSQTGAVS